jgi:hypothetical protein
MSVQGTGGVSEAGIDQMRSVCGNALFLMASSMPHSHRLLWPFILHFLSDAQYSTALPEVCRTVVGVADRVRKEDMAVDFAAHQDIEILHPPALLARLLVPLCTLATPAQGTHANAHVHIINALRALGVFFPPTVAAHFETQLPLLLEAHAPATRALDASSSASAHELSPWTQRVVAMFLACLEGADEAFVMAVGEALIAQRPLHVDDEAWSEGTNTLLGPVFASVSDERFVRMGLQNMLVETDHSSFMESRGCAHAFQYCAPRHLGPAIEVLEQMLKDVHPRDISLHQRASQWLGLSALAGSRRHADEARTMAVATALTALGHVLRR